MKKLIYLLFFAIIFGQETSKDNIQNISIVSTANVYSEFYDCGCPKNPLGGLARKTFFLKNMICLLYTSPSPRDMRRSRMPSSA